MPTGGLLLGCRLLSCGLALNFLSCSCLALCFQAPRRLGALCLLSRDFPLRGVLLGCRLTLCLLSGYFLLRQRLPCGRFAFGIQPRGLQAFCFEPLRGPGP